MRTKSDGFYHAVSVAVVALALALWGGLSTVGMLETNTFPPVQAIWEALHELVTRGYSGSPFYVQILASMGRAISGFVPAVLVGVPLGIWITNPCSRFRGPTKCAAPAVVTPDDVAALDAEHYLAAVIDDGASGRGGRLV